MSSHASPFRRLLAVTFGTTAVLCAVTVFILTRGGSRPAGVVPPETPQRAVPRDLVPAIPFTDITASAGITLVHESAAAGEMLLPETLGGGAAFFDYDNDGDADLLLVNGAPWSWNANHDQPPPGPALYRNDGTGRFSDASPGSGLPKGIHGFGVACGDVDADGRTDVFLTALGRNHLLRNLGDGRFQDFTDEAGVAGEEDAWSTSAGFFDYDDDGDLDLFVANYARWTPAADRNRPRVADGGPPRYADAGDFPARHSYLYRNDGAGRLVDVSEESGIHVTDPRTGQPRGRALGLTFLDVNRNGRLDVYVANDGDRDFLFLNQGDGTFAERGELFGLTAALGGGKGSTGVSAGYYRDDETVGVLVGRRAGESVVLQVSRDDRFLFSDDAVLEGLGGATVPAATYGVLFLDADLDGRLDVLLANGHPQPNIAAITPGFVHEQPAQLFWNAGRSPLGSFVQVPPELTGDLAEARVGRAVTAADIDGDGDLDLLITQPGRRAALLRNDQATGHNWLRVVLAGPEGNPQAIGALVEVIAGSFAQRRRVMPTRGYLSQTESVVTFGLGPLPAVDRIRVTWPDGALTEAENPALNTVLTLHQAEPVPALPAG